MDDFRLDEVGIDIPRDDALEVGERWDVPGRETYRLVYASKSQVSEGPSASTVRTGQPFNILGSRCLEGSSAGFACVPARPKALSALVCQEPDALPSIGAGVVVASSFHQASLCTLVSTMIVACRFSRSPSPSSWRESIPRRTCREVAPTQPPSTHRSAPDTTRLRKVEEAIRD